MGHTGGCELAIRQVRYHISATLMEYRLFRRRSGLCLVLACIITAFLASCTTAVSGKPKVKVKSVLQEKEYVSYDGDRLGYRKWVSENKKPKTVIIGVHGISGHADDYDNLGVFLKGNNPSIVIYAAETRGQGMDPVKDRRGDIRDVKEWFNDLYTFTDLVRKKNPGAKIVWFGESMGSLIVMHAYNHTPTGFSKPDAMIVSSPIVDIQSKVAPWKVLALRVSTFLMPTLRLSLESLSNGERVKVTQADVHEEQVAKNEWYIPRYTLRLLLKLGDLAQAMPQQAEKVDCPVLVMHGGNDIFTTTESVEMFYNHLPEKVTKARKFYPDAYHLLMYDEKRELIFKNATEWVDGL